MYFVKLLANFFTIFIHLSIIHEGDFSGNEFHSSSSSNPTVAIIEDRITNISEVEYCFDSHYNVSESGQPPTWDLAVQNENFIPAQKEICMLLHDEQENKSMEKNCELSYFSYILRGSSYCVKFVRIQPRRSKRWWKNRPADFLGCYCALVDRLSKAECSTRRFFLVTRASPNWLFKAHAEGTGKNATAFLQAAVKLQEPVPEKYKL